jgi:hypothetical protein
MEVLEDLDIRVQFQDLLLLMALVVAGELKFLLLLQELQVQRVMQLLVLVEDLLL